MKQFIVKLVDMILLLLLVVLSAWIFAACSKSEESLPDNGTARTEERQNDANTDSLQEDNTKRVGKPERTLIFGEETEAEEREGESGAAESDMEVRVTEPSALLQRNAAFLELSGTSARYPFDLIIGKLASYEDDEGYSEVKTDNDKVAVLAERFVKAAFEGKMNILKQLSSPAAQDSLSVQVKAWETHDIQIEEIRIGEIHAEDAKAHFDFRIIGQLGRVAGNAVAVFVGEGWTVQAIDVDVGQLQVEYQPPEYSDFPDNYGYFQ